MFCSKALSFALVNYSFISSKILLLSILFYQSMLWAPINFSNQSSTLKLEGLTSKLLLDAGLTTTGGTVFISPETSNPIIGNPLIFEKTNVQFGAADVRLTGTFASSATNTLELNGNCKLDGNLGQILAPVLVSGPNNYISGFQSFSTDLILTDSGATLYLGQKSIMNKNIQLNNGTLILTNDLPLAPGVSLVGPGTVIGNNYEIKDLTGVYTTNMTFSGGMTLELDTKFGVELRGATWSFVGLGKTSALESDGVANITLSQGGKIYIGPGHTLSISNIFIEGLDNFYHNILDIEPTGRLMMNRSTISLSTDYFQNSGTIIVTGDPSRIASSTHHLHFTNDSALIVDGTVLFYDNLNQPDSNPLIFDDQLSQLVLLNDGVVKSNRGENGVNGIDATNIEVDKIITQNFAQLTNDLNLKASSRIIFQNSTSGWKNVFLDGQGYSIRFVQSAAKYFLMDPHINLTLTNVHLKDFWPPSIDRNGGTITFGDGVLIDLARNTDLYETYKVQGTVFIEGSGNQLILHADDTLLVESFSTLYLSGCSIVGTAGGSNSGRLRSIAGPAYPSTIVLQNSDLWLDTNYNFSAGSMAIFSKSRIFGDDKIFSWTTTGTLTINPGSTLKLERNLTFSYAPNPAPIFIPNPYQSSKERILFADSSANLILSGCSLYSTHTGIRLKTGRVSIENEVKFISKSGIEEGPYGHGAQSSGEEFEIGKSATIEILAGANLELIGKFKYVDL